MRRPSVLVMRLAALLGCGVLGALLVAPSRAPATRREVVPVPVSATPGSTVAPPLLQQGSLQEPPARPVDPRAHRLRVPPPLPARPHRLHLIPPTLRVVPFEAPVIPSDAPPKLYDPSPETGRRMGAPQLLAPGALPDGFRYHYADDYTGWPVAALHSPHALHGAFNDPREGGYHFGVDIAVDDSKPALLAPPGMSHRIFAVESGELHYPRHAELALNCNDRRFQVGHFSYWHASPAWPDGTQVRAGQMIGWTCLNEWHVHLSEWALVNGQRTWVNPLHRAGKLQPYIDLAKPVVRAVYAYGPPAGWWQPQRSDQLAGSDGATSLVLGNLHGVVDLRAWIDDSQGTVGLYRDRHQVATGISPYRVWVRIQRVADGAVVWQRDAWRSDMLLSGREPLYAHFAARSRPPLSEHLCALSLAGCSGRLFYHLVVSGDRYLWDTRSVRDGAYVLTIRAFDISGNEGERSVPLTVRN